MEPKEKLEEPQKEDTYELEEKWETPDLTPVYGINMCTGYEYGDC